MPKMRAPGTTIYEMACHTQSMQNANLRHAHMAKIFLRIPIDRLGGANGFPEECP